jgi:hypothetical protein
MREEDILPTEKKYIEIQYDEFTQGYLREFCREQGFDLTTRFNGKSQDEEDFDFHTTVFHTTTKHNIDNGAFDIHMPVTPVGFELFGDNENILVMLIESDGLDDIRQHYQAEFDMADEWPDFKPHISVCYDYDGELPTFDPQDFLTEPLVAGKLNVKSQKKSK